MKKLDWKRIGGTTGIFFIIFLFFLLELSPVVALATTSIVILLSISFALGIGSDLVSVFYHNGEEEK